MLLSASGHTDGYNVWTYRGSSLAGVGLFFPLELMDASADVRQYLQESVLPIYLVEIVKSIYISFPSNY